MRDDQAVDVAIIGAGPAGLTAAYQLTKLGYSVTVIERIRSMSAGSAAPSSMTGFGSISAAIASSRNRKR